MSNIKKSVWLREKNAVKLNFKAKPYVGVDVEKVLSFQKYIFIETNTHFSSKTNK